MNKDLAAGEISSEVDYDLSFKEGKLELAIKYSGKGGGVDLVLKLESDYFLDKLADAIPGKFDDAAIALLKGALK